MDSGLTPARTVIAKLGGEAAVASIAGTAITAPYRWQAPKERGGTGGVIPTRHQKNLLEYARGAGIDLTPGDFFQLDDSPQATGDAA